MSGKLSFDSHIHKLIFSVYNTINVSLNELKMNVMGHATKIDKTDVVLSV